jgi:lysophospholipase L1-like esterase
MLQNNIRAMVLLAKANDIPVILATIGPAKDIIWRPQVDRGKWVPLINGWLEQFAREEGLVLADYHAVLADTAGSMRKELFADTVHPNSAGYEAMTRVLHEALERAGNDSEPSG